MTANDELADMIEKPKPKPNNWENGENQSFFLGMMVGASMLLVLGVLADIALHRVHPASSAVKQVSQSPVYDLSRKKPPWSTEGTDYINPPQIKIDGDDDGYTIFSKQKNIDGHDCYLVYPSGRNDPHLPMFPYHVAAVCEKCKK